MIGPGISCASRLKTICYPVRGHEFKSFLRLIPAIKRLILNSTRHKTELTLSNL
ncbi:MAG: hypothetical protein JWM11_2018 [Planctomycetaceae bacterium]|nr:hypothetical protein [Planctomycetaceae bacterium]